MTYSTVRWAVLAIGGLLLTACGREERAPAVAPTEDERGVLAARSLVVRACALTRYIDFGVLKSWPEESHPYLDAALVLQDKASDAISLMEHQVSEGDAGKARAQYDMALALLDEADRKLTFARDLRDRE